MSEVEDGLTLCEQRLIFGLMVLLIPVHASGIVGDVREFVIELVSVKLSSAEPVGIGNRVVVMAALRRWKKQPRRVVSLQAALIHRYREREFACFSMYLTQAPQEGLTCEGIVGLKEFQRASRADGCQPLIWARIWRTRKVGAFSRNVPGGFVLLNPHRGKLLRSARLQ